MTRLQWIEQCAARFKEIGHSDYVARDCAITEFNIRCRDEPMDSAPELSDDRWPSPRDAADEAMLWSE